MDLINSCCHFEQLQIDLSTDVRIVLHQMGQMPVPATGNMLAPVCIYLNISVLCEGVT
jgi:hypothetical protein